MQKEITNKAEIKLVGLTARTNNMNEMGRSNAKIAPLVKRYFTENLSQQISDRANPGITIAGYTDYESDERGDYTYFVGEEVTSFDTIPEGFTAITVPAAKYQKFTTVSGKMPNVVINAWVEIWTMQEKELGGKRAYQADFEIYDQRAMDPQNAVVDIYVGLQ